MHIFVIFDKFVQVQETNNNFYLVEVTNNGRTTEGEYRVALPDGRVQVEIFFGDLVFYSFISSLHWSKNLLKKNPSYNFSPQIVAYYADDDGFHAKVWSRLFVDKKTVLDEKETFKPGSIRKRRRPGSRSGSRQVWAAEDF